MPKVTQLGSAGAKTPRQGCRSGFESALTSPSTLLCFSEPQFLLFSSGGDNFLIIGYCEELVRVSHRIASVVVKGGCFWLILIFEERTGPQKQNLSVYALQIEYAVWERIFEQRQLQEAGLGEGVRAPKRCQLKLNLHVILISIYWGSLSIMTDF